jgi:GNAT superfamily N-acetyltransferase
MNARVITVRVTEAQDVPAIRAMTVAVGVFSSAEVAVVDELLDAYFTQGAETSGYFFLSALVDDQVVAFACYGPRDLTTATFDLYWIVTAPSAGRQGVGGHLLCTVEGRVMAQGGRILIAETSGRADYAKTRNFYVKHGYVAEAQIRDFYSPGDDLVIYVRRIPTVPPSLF